jgi:hypothetical protein
MTEDQRKLELIERDERWLFPMLDSTPSPSQDTLCRVREVVSAELQSRLLGRFADPSPDAATVEKVRLAVRSELLASSRRTRARRAWWVALGSLSAAAALAIAVGLVRFAVPTPSPRPVAKEGLDSQLVEDMAMALQSVGQRHDPAITVLGEDIDRLMDSSMDGRRDAIDEELQDISNEIDGLFAQQTSSQET